MSSQRYPLDWPQGYPRHNTGEKWRVNRPGFKSITLTQAVDLLVDEVRKLQGKAYNRDPDLNISSNIPLRNDGFPRADYLRLKIDDPGVAAYFKYSGEDVVLCCDKFQKVEDNVKAIAITIEDMRRIERNGVSDFIKRSFMGFKALPEYTTPHFWEVLQMPFMPNPTPAMWLQIQKQYRTLAKAYHPDAGGNAEDWHNITRAYDEATRYFKNVI
jgi:hypothetical protein